MQAKKWIELKRHWFLCVLLALHGSLLAWSANSHSPVNGEVPALAAGIRHWQDGRFDLFRVNPPLVRMAAALPVLFLQPATDWSRLTDFVGGRPEFDVGEDFIRANGERSFWLFTLARWTCIPFSVLGGYVCFRWARELYGFASGIAATILWCFSPNIIAHAQLISGDGGATALGVVAGYLFWRWIYNPTWRGTVLAGLALGLAELSKTTWIVLFLLWPALWLAWRLAKRPSVSWRHWGLEVTHLTAILVLGICVVNLGYGGEGSFHRLGDIRFISRTLAGTVNHKDGALESGNRFCESWCASVYVPLPLNYVQGIDIQKRDFEARRYSYLAGQWAGGGWWYYYLYALAMKEPLGSWCLVVLAIGVTIVRRGYSASWRDEIVVLAPFLVILVFVSSQTGFSVHSRYILPALPFLFIWASKVARVFELRPFPTGSRHPFTGKRLAMATVIVIALTWAVGSSLAVYPHSLSYFNELAAVLPTPADAVYPKPAGRNAENRSVWSRVTSMLTAGPRNGPRHLLDSNIDWGQDLFYLKDWIDQHPKAKLKGLAYWGSYPATLAGIPETPNPPTGTERERCDSSQSDSAAKGGLPTDHPDPKPGWYALSVNYIYSRDRQYRYFLNFRPAAMAGYSIYIYHITQDEANRVRKESGRADRTQ
jgi:hypothetical protein